MRLVLPLALLAACGDNYARPDAPIGDTRAIDGPVDAARPDGNPLTPNTLAGTGLCLDAACTQISSDVRAYTPRFALWSDGATKRRWIYLPPGSQIDTTDMDHWVFPMGTKIWKEFTRDGTRVETRYIAKIGPGNNTGDWYYVAYAWNQTQDATTAVTQGVMNANGTQHDIPSRSQCKFCHENLQPTRILGFGAIQLDTAAATGEIALADLVANNQLTTPPTGSSPYFPLPTGTTDAQNAIGYLHANCGHCHNPTSTVYTATGITMQLRLTVGSLADITTTPVYVTAVNHDATQMLNGHAKIVQPADPSHSVMIDRFESTNPSLHMPATGTEVMDPTGDATLTSWITNLPP